MEEPLIGLDTSGPPFSGNSGTYSREGETDTFSQLSVRAGTSKGEGNTSSAGRHGEPSGTSKLDSNLESIDYLPANNAPWREHVTKQERMKSNW